MFQSFNTRYFGNCFGLTVLSISRRNLREPDIQELADDEARILLFDDFGLELPQNATNIQISRRQSGDSRISLSARMSFTAIVEDMTLWLESINAYNLSYSFEESKLRPIDFQWDNAPNWWQPQEAINVILSSGNVVPSSPHLYYLLVDTDDNEIWTTYLYISFP